MIANDFNVPNLSGISHYLIPVRTKLHTHNDLTDDISLNHNNPKSRKQKRMLGYMNQTEGHHGLYNPKFSILTLDKKKDDNASWLKLTPQKLLPRPSLLIIKHNKPYLPILMYQINPSSSPALVFHQLKRLIIKINKAAENHKNITTKTYILDGILKGI
ncbi:hypothetical protein O181_125815 [Austropuccinia psidii MF-1]|uniref:Uncharacterized protein n=1 Tax=Austropuccinia psidii MF-1 TaxID=1389203 RepID=A0A9Q3Q6H2_9BASI|nr:hypothetical protein [Austropuccinia psidii MF-1]